MNTGRHHQRSKQVNCHSLPTHKRLRRMGLRSQPQRRRHFRVWIPEFKPEFRMKIELAGAPVQAFFFWLEWGSLYTENQLPHISTLLGYPCAL